jgi:hypothetical protein
MTNGKSFNLGLDRRMKKIPNHSKCCNLIAQSQVVRKPHPNLPPHPHTHTKLTTKVDQNSRKIGNAKMSYREPVWVQQRIMDALPAVPPGPSSFRVCEFLNYT